MSQEIENATPLSPPTTRISLTPMLGPPSTSLHQPLPPPPTSPAPTPVSSSSSLSSSSASLHEPTAHSENGPQSSAQTHPLSTEPTAPQNNRPQPTAQSSNPPRKSTKTQPNQRLQPIEPAPHIEPLQNIHKMKTRAKNQITKPNKKFSVTVSTTSSSP